MDLLIKNTLRPYKGLFNLVKIWLEQLFTKSVKDKILYMAQKQSLCLLMQ